MVEKQIRKFINNIGSLIVGSIKNRPRNVHLADVDCLGNAINSVINDNAAILSDDEQLSSMEEEQIEVFINRLQRKKNYLKKIGTNVRYTIPRKSPSPKKGFSSRKGPIPAEQDFLRKNEKGDQTHERRKMHTV